MDLNTVTEVVRARRREDFGTWRTGDAWLAGGSWLFSEPQTGTTRLIDLTSLGWTPLAADDNGLAIAATCTVAQLEALAMPAAWTAAPLFNQCCRAFVASFKIWNVATVGGNLCMALPAGPMISLTVALDGICTIWTADGGERSMAAADFVLGPQRNALRPGEVLRRIALPAVAMRRRTAFRQIALTPLGRSAALLIGTLADDGVFALTVTASTARPVKLAFAILPSWEELHRRIVSEIPETLYYDDVHGTPAWRRHMTLHFAQEILRELAGESPA